MEHLKIDRWEFEYSRADTEACYSSLPLGVGCSCESCKNYEALNGAGFSKQYLELFQKLGIDHRKSPEVSHYCRERSGKHHLAGWFHFVGKLKTGRDGWKKNGSGSYTGDFHGFGENESIGISERISLLPEVFKGKQVLQLEFEIRVNWVINEAEWE